MKIEMKKIFLLLLFALLSLQNNYGQDLPPPPTDCETCLEMYNDGLLDQAGLDACRAANNCEEGLPINSNILILFTAAIALGVYSKYKNHKKRPLEN